ncbi:hypothetical protein M758_5G079600 [Ceratodon purpureus]|nr:hypothetical protein M758_5G079600 [Ceratodon purpureus]
MDRVYQELESQARALRPSCRSRALLPAADLIAFLQRLATCRPEDRALAVVEAPELHCFLALQALPKGQGTDGLGQTQSQVIEVLCERNGGLKVPPVAGCTKALRTIFLHYESNELVSVRNTVDLLHECAKKGWWDVARLVVGRLCTHMKSADLGVIEQKVLGVMRDSLVPFGVCCLAVLLEPLHRMVFLHLSSLMAQGSAPEVDSFPPAIKWYLRLLRKCAGKVVGSESQSAASIIKKSDIDFLFWPFIIPSVEMKANFTLCKQTPSEEARDWSLRYGMHVKRWRDSLIDQLRSDLRMPKATDLQSVDEEPCYNWLPFAEYALSSDQWMWLHDFLLHSKGSVRDIESRHKRFLEISATGARILGIGAALVEILAQEMRTCKSYHVPENMQEALSDSNGIRQDHAAECCGCIHQDSKCTGNAAALLIWLFRPDSTESCDDTWVIVINNLLLSSFNTRERFAIRSYDPSGELLSDRVDPGLTHEDKEPLQVIDSTIITLVQNEKEFILNKWPNGAIQLRAQTFKQAERSKWRLEEVVWPALLSYLSCFSYSFTCHRVLEILETFGPRCLDVDDLSKDKSPFPRLQLHMEQFLRLVKLSPIFFLPLLRFSLSASKVAAINCFKPGDKKNHSLQDYASVQLDLCELQEEEFMAAVYHCVSQESEVWTEQPDFLLLQVVAFSGGSFRYLVGECERSEEPSKSNVMQKSGTQSNARIFRGLVARGKEDSDTSGLVTAIEGRRLLAWKLRAWNMTSKAVSNVLVKENLSKLEALNKIYIWVSALRTKFPPVDTWVGIGLSGVGRALRVHEEDALWEREFTNEEADKGARSAKRPRLSSSTTSALPTMSLGAEREDPEWIVEALCRSSVSLERYLMLYLGFNDTKRGRPRKSQATGSKQKVSSEVVCLHRQNVVSYFAKFPSQIPNLSSLCWNTSIYQVACESIQEAATNTSLTHGSDIFELWFQFLEKLREVGSVRSSTYLEKGSLLKRMTECALRHPTLISNWPQDLLENLVSVSPGLVHRICEELRGHIESRLVTELKDVEKNSNEFTLSGVVAAMDLKPKVVAEYLESTLVATYSNVEKASQPPKSRSSLLDLLSIVFALCKPESRNIVLLHLQESNLCKSTIKGFDVIPLQAPVVDARVRRAEVLQAEQHLQKDQLVLLGPAFVLAVVLWRCKILKDLKPTYVRRGDLTSTDQISDAFQMDQNLSHSELRAAICHVLLTSEPQLCINHQEGDQRAQTDAQTSYVSGEEMVFQLQAFASLEENPSLCRAINSWILLCCRMSVSLNLDHIRALCRLHPCMIRDALIKRIEEEMMEASRVGGKSGWKNCLEQLKEGLLQGLLSWLPLDGRSHFTTTVGVPSGFWLGSNSKGVEEILSCLSSTDVGVRRSAYYLVVTHQHHHHFVSSLTLELCKKVVSSEFNIEQEALLGVLVPVLLSEPHTASFIVDSVVVLFRKAKELALSPGSCVEETNVTSFSEPQHVKALLRVALLACEVSPDSFATEEIALLLITLAMVEDPLEEIAVSAIQCLGVLAMDLQVTLKNMKIVQGLLIHLVYKPAGDYVWQAAMTFADRFSAGIAHRKDTALGVKKNSTIESSFQIQELLHRCPLQRSVPLQAILKRLDHIHSYQP